MFEVRVTPFQEWEPIGWLYTTWDRTVESLDGTRTELNFSLSDVEEVLFQGQSSDADWDGEVAAVFKLKDGRFVSYETFWGPTGDGFCEDAYGGDAKLFFAANLKTIVNYGLTEEGRRLASVPKELWNE